VGLSGGGGIAYRNSVDAFIKLLSPTVNHISARSGCMQNGIAYCVVQVIFASGEECRIEAYDEEAEDLYRIAAEQSALLSLH
jgi:hypothetical protein